MGIDVLKDEKTIVARDASGRWLPGQSANPAGRGMTNRQRISERLLADLADVWERHGASVLERLAVTEPAKLATIAYGLLPRDVFVQVQHELAQHGGNDNGRLPVTYGQFMEYGIDRHAISPAIRELEALGFVEVTQRGKPSAGDLRWPNFFRLTCVNSKSSTVPSHEWRRIKTRQDAELLATAARKVKGKKQSPSVETPHCTDGENPHCHAQFPMWKSHTTSPVLETPTTSISRVKVTDETG
jgi:hypothetical protein